jgi:hypothetical protein
MKNWLVILILLILPALSVFAQEEQVPQQPEEGGKIQQRMREYIQDKLHLSRDEADKFSPVFVRYFREFVKTHRQFKGDRLILQQKIIELRLRYRPEFRQAMQEQKADRVYLYEDEFRKKAMEIIKENRRARMDKPPLRTNRVLLQ